ncbi:translocation/assembly module TamB domain-containing protein [Fundidesulfovibrio putealis]|uniref:hypothetical protein n=1 Tax=Fundidesulfovibrio putealis TaxID=270496 RepID=UPI000414F8E3|nr:hypothetical protein [Fundidesulfovibrio putealis]
MPHHTDAEQTGQSAPRSKWAVRVALGVLCLLGAALGAVALVMASSEGRLFLVNAVLRAAGQDASVESADLGLFPPQLALSGLVARRALPAEMGGHVNIRVASLTLARDGLAPDGLRHMWRVEVESPDVSALFESLPKAESRTPGSPSVHLPPLPDNVRVSLRGGAFKAFWPGGEASAAQAALSMEPGGEVVLQARAAVRLNASMDGIDAHAESLPAERLTLPDVADKAPGKSLAADARVVIRGNLDPASSKANVNFRLDQTELVTRYFRASLESNGELVAKAEDLNLDSFALRLERVRLTDEGAALPESLKGFLEGAQADMLAHGRFQKGVLDIEVDRIAVPGLLAAQGRIEGSRDQGFVVSTQADLADLRRLAPLVQPLMPENLRDLKLDGQTAISLNLELPSGGPVRASAAVSSPSMGIASASLGVEGVLSIVAAFDDGALSGQVAMRGAVKRPELSLPAFQFEAGLGGRLPTITVEAVNFRASLGQFAGGMAFPEIKAHGGAGMTVSQGRVSGVVSMIADACDLGTLSCSVGMDSGAPGSLVVERAHATVQLERLAEVLGLPALTAGKSGEKNRVSARAAADRAGKSGTRSAKPGAATGAVGVAGNVEAWLKPGELAAGRLAHVEARLKDVRIDLPERASFGTGLSGSVGLDFDPGAPQTLAVSIALQGGALHLPDALLEFSKHPAKVNAKIQLIAPDKGADVSAEASLARLASVGVKGRFTPSKKGWTGQGDATIALPDLSGLASALAPALSGQDGVQVQGKARMRLGFAEGLAAPKLTGRGEVELTSLRAHGVESTGLRIPVILTRDSLRLWDETSPALELMLLGGRLTLSRPEVRNPFEPTFEARLSARLTELPLAELSKGKLSSAASGNWETITLTKDMLNVDGELTAKAFGGDLVVMGLKVARPFAADRQFRVHAGLLGADMRSVSAMAGVGRITGRLNVTLSELHMAGFLPLAFTLRVESLPEPGVEQRISLGAVDSLTEVSAGGRVDPGLAARAALMLFGDFGYKKLGLLIGLKGAMCTVRGLHHENGVEYILKRSGLAGVDVVNGNPENAMPFADLLVRIKKIMNRETKPGVEFGMGHGHDAPRPAKIKVPAPSGIGE